MEKRISEQNAPCFLQEKVLDFRALTYLRNLAITGIQHCQFFLKASPIVTFLRKKLRGIQAVRSMLSKSMCMRKCLRKVMAIRVVEFSNGDTKLERFLPKNQHTQRKLLNFEIGLMGRCLKVQNFFVIDIF